MKGYSLSAARTHTIPFVEKINILRLRQRKSYRASRPVRCSCFEGEILAYVCCKAPLC